MFKKRSGSSAFKKTSGGQDWSNKRRRKREGSGVGNSDGGTKSKEIDDLQKGEGLQGEEGFSRGRNRPKHSGARSRVVKRNERVGNEPKTNTDIGDQQRGVSVEKSICLRRGKSYEGKKEIKQ